jgi:cell division protein FtsB
VVLVLCGLYFAVAFAGQAWKAKTLGETLSAERATLRTQQATNAELQTRLDGLTGSAYDTYAERVAREKLGMVKPGDRAVLVVPDPKAPSLAEEPAPLPADLSAPQAAPPPQPVWRQWVAVFFP